MGLLDGLVGSLMGGRQQGSDSPLLQMALQMLANRSDTGAGGLGGLINSFRNAGLGEQLKSWIGTGQNMPISADQLTAALGSDKIRDIASQLGLPHGDVSGGLAEMLPQLIDKLSPNGQLPADHNLLQDALSAFMKR
jgi:uncharacterized protein YidB (DUF937 family)